jgi:two-component system response regulator HydG
MAEDSAELYRRTKIHGYGGGSSFERIPIANLVTNSIKQFCSIPRQSNAQKPGEGFGELVGASPIMLKLFRLIKRVAPYDVSVCIEGESGVGKELVATQLHRLSDHASEPFIMLNCGAIPETLVESELFGHEKGAFTGAVSRRIGKFELADQGTLLLDEVAELSAKAQVSLLRVLQQNQITRVGGEKAIPVNVRIIAATHQNLKELVAQKRFRADLYFRLNMITLKVPPLRERTHDIPVLVNKLLAELGSQFGQQVLGLTQEFMRLLMKHAWPGNIRELKHVLCRAILLEDGPILKGEDFVPELILTSQAFEQQTVIPIAPLIKDNEFGIVRNAINAAGGNKSKAAKLLGISRKTLYSRLKKMKMA